MELDRRKIEDHGSQMHSKSPGEAVELINQALNADTLKQATQLSLQKIFADSQTDPLAIWQRIEHELPQVIENERRFAHTVIERFSRWSEEDAAVVLWDVDGTIGVRHAFIPRAELKLRDLHYAWSLSDFSSSCPSTTWGFRPAMLPLCDLLPQAFPKIVNGILSGRSYSELYSCIDDPLELKPIKTFVGERIFSAHVDLQPGESPELHQLNKINVREKLRSEGMNIKVIDDNQVAVPEEHRGNGLHVERFSIDPRFSVFL